MVLSSTLRVIDAGVVSPVASQSLWHAIATAGGPVTPTLSLARARSGYVSIGRTRPLDDVDQRFCHEHGLPVFRRMVGGGAVYVDHQQLLFQLILPVEQADANRPRLLASVLGPVVAAFQACGVPARLNPDGEITADDRKICGHGAGLIGGAVVVVGNLIDAFDHDRATAVLALDPEEERPPVAGAAGSAPLRAEVLRLMRRHVGATPVSARTFTGALTDGLARLLSLTPRPSDFTAAEVESAQRWNRRLGSRSWLEDVRAPARHPHRAVKVRAGVGVARLCSRDGQRTVADLLVTSVAGRVERATVLRWPTDAPPQLVGADVRDAARRLTLTGVGTGKQDPGPDAEHGLPDLADQLLAADRRFHS